MKPHFEYIGEKVLNSFEYLGGVFVLLARIIAALPKCLKYFHLTVYQMMFMGVNSLPLVVFTSIFTGMVSAIQANYQLGGRAPLIYIGMGICKAVLTELGPVLTALVVTGRVGAAIAAELGTMRVTEQIDALESLAIDPIHYLVLPRFLAGAIMIPVLTIFAILVALLGGWLVSILSLSISTQLYLDGLRLYFYKRDLIGGLVKAVFFGIIIATMGCYHGFKTRGGAEGVGRATTEAVVSSAVLILIFDYLVSSLIFG
ncbi:MAG: ABC transporter permease [Candidatus Edwardsbacteria bacterium]